MDTNFQQDEMWRTAKKRAEFKWSLTSYILVNGFLVIIWALSDTSYFWPAWCMAGWGLGLAIQYFKAYHRNSWFSAEKEYEKMKKEGNR